MSLEQHLHEAIVNEWPRPREGLYEAHSEGEELQPKGTVGAGARPSLESEGCRHDLTWWAAEMQPLIP